MPRPRKYEDAASKQMAYRMRKERERLVLGAAMLDLARAVRQARAHGTVLVALDHIPTDDQARMVRELAQAIDKGSKAMTANTTSSSTLDATDEELSAAEQTPRQPGAPRLVPTRSTAITSTSVTEPNDATAPLR